MYYEGVMKAINVRLPDELMAEIDAESRLRRLSKSDVIRQRLQGRQVSHRDIGFDTIANLVGSVVDDLPADLSARKKHYLRVTGYGGNRSR